MHFYYDGYREGKYDGDKHQLMVIISLYFYDQAYKLIKDSLLLSVMCYCRKHSIHCNVNINGKLVNRL